MALTDKLTENPEENRAINNQTSRRGFLGYLVASAATLATTLAPSTSYACPKRNKKEQPKRQYTYEDFEKLLIEQGKIKDTKPDRKFLKSLWGAIEDEYKPLVYKSQANPKEFCKKEMTRKERRELRKYSNPKVWGQGVYESHRKMFPWISEKPERLTLDQKLLIYLDNKRAEKHLRKYEGI